MLVGQAMKSKLIDLSEIINTDLSCENKDHRHRKPYDGSFFAVVNLTQGGIYDGFVECLRRFPWLYHGALKKYGWLVRRVIHVGSIKGYRIENKKARITIKTDFFL